MASRVAVEAVPKHLMTLADFTPVQIDRLLVHAHYLKQTSKPWLAPMKGLKDSNKLRLPPASLFNKSIALLFSKRSTRTRLAAETATNLLGGQSLFLGKDDIQLGVNETADDSAKVIGRMCQGVFARVGDHSEIEEFAANSPVPVINALSSLWHPTQVLADLLTLREHAHSFIPDAKAPTGRLRTLPNLPKITIAYVGDSANVLHDMMVTYPRMGCQLRIAVPPQAQYQPPKAVWDRVEDLGCRENIWIGSDPLEAVKDADVVVTDTWISMGQEAEKEQRLKDFQGYQVTEQMCTDGGAKPHWQFMHCLPRKQDEVNDAVFHGPRSIVWDEAENRKWTIMALFDTIYGKWDFGMDRAAAAAKK